MFWRRRNRSVELRSEHNGADSRYLTVYSTRSGGLRIAGQDLGPSTEVVSPDGEYEWFYDVPAASVPQLRSALGTAPGTDLMDDLAARWCGLASHDLEVHLSALRHSGAISLTVW